LTNKLIKTHKEWVKLYVETNDAGYVCRRCGISHLTLRKWYKRYLVEGEDGLSEQNKRPLTLPKQKVQSQHVRWILDLRIKNNAGARRIQSELIRLYHFSLLLATIHKILTKPTHFSVLIGFI
jgi:transposase-like protein